jgi:hypothetical protein
MLQDRMLTDPDPIFFPHDERNADAEGLFSWPTALHTEGIPRLFGCRGPIQPGTDW